MRCRVLCLSLWVFLGWATESWAFCLQQGSWGGTSATGINLVSSVGSDLNQAMNIWNNGCGQAIPPLTKSGSASTSTGVLNLNVIYQTAGEPCGSRTNACGCASRTKDQYGATTGGTIKVFGSTADGSNCDGNVASSFAHEIGHFLGLGDDYSGACQNNVMYGYTKANLVTVSAAQCNFIDLEWHVPNEDECDTEPAPRGCDNGIDNPNSPIVLDLQRDGFHFTSLHAGVAFDLNADGTAERTAWVGDPWDAFLYRDLNGNGLVDDGGELFGNHTALANGSRADHGFEALLEFDQVEHGGNGDGVLDSNDWIYFDLRLWTDTNLNGATDPGETVGLPESPVRAISLAYRMTRQHDRFGNLLTYWSQVDVLRHDQVVPTKAVDVFFQTEDP